jgi:hypothetical protein
VESGPRTSWPLCSPGLRSPREQTALPRDYAVLRREIKDRIAQAQARAVLSVNAELVRLYWDIGRIIHARQKEEGWGLASFPGWPES